MMNSSKLSHIFLFFLIFCMANSFKLSYCIGSNSIVFCPEIEKQALISFKQSLEDPSNLLSSWNIGQVNCCSWKGVVCSNLTGHVHQLHLQSRNQSQGLRGKINPSLLNLKHLKYLDLSHNNFGETVPSFIGFFTSLEYLNLSYAGFHGTIPNNIGNLSNLHTLSLEDYQRVYGSDLEDYDRVSVPDVDSIEWLFGLSQLEYLNMNYVNLSKAVNWVQVINTLPSLVELHLCSCYLSSMAQLRHANISITVLDLSGNFLWPSVIPKWIFQQSKLIFLDLSYNGFPIPTTSNTTKLQYIDLSQNDLNSSIPDWLYFCKDLEFVHLAGNSLQNTISNAIGNLTSLNTFDLSDNELSGKIPREIANLCKMQKLDLSVNMLQGDISDSFGNMSDCFLGGLKFLSLGWNQLSGQITDQFGKFKSLQTLYLCDNLLSGAIPTNLGKVSPLEELILRDNKLIENLPESMGQLYNLVVLEIGNTMLEGVVTESHFANLSKLKYFYASGSHLTLKVRPNWIPPFKLKELYLGSWNLGAGSIPSWIELQKNIYGLDLSNTGISGNVASWFWEIGFLNLSKNQLRGKIPDINPLKVGDAHLIYLSSNQFSGSLPRVANDVLELDLSNNSFSGGISHFLCEMTNESYMLEILHLGGNQLTGEIPDCWTKWLDLIYLNLGNNNMSGSIPSSIGFLVHLVSLNLYGNKLSGQIPFPMHNCTQLVKIDLSSNHLVGNIPTWIGTSLAYLRFLILRSNKLSGEISSDICHLKSLQILDLSDNNFSGIIPRCVDNFTAMATSLAEYENSELFYSEFVGVFIESASVVTKGSEFHYDTILSLVTNIDLSNNNLAGDIPKELTSLVELRSLNLSRNHLTGSIPDSIGDMKQLESLDLSRNSLFGEIPNSFAVMSFLNDLNLSYNHLTGRIPECTQLMGMDASSFIGNNLCGPPLSNCSHDHDEPLHKEVDKGVKSEINWFYVLLSLGYAMGFSVVCTILVLNKSWREAYFGFLKCTWDRIYVYSYCKWLKLRGPSGPSLRG